MRYVWGFLAVALGFVVIWKTEKLLEMFGRVDWAEAHLNGGTRFFYKLVGLAFILLAFLYMSGWVGDALMFIFVPGSRGGGL
ncbi:hypothetical protein HYV74_01855 [Candidatus Uhrbacteria bacterium]|nr:hypothetical protein [Candidatus Uhrbacteria bacterium]